MLERGRFDALFLADIRNQVSAAGRDSSDLLFIQGFSFVIGSTEEARSKACDLDAYRSDDGLLAHISRDLGIDLGLLEPEQPLDDLEVEGMQGPVRLFKEANLGKRATVTDVASAHAYNTRLVGPPRASLTRSLNGSRRASTT